jgi:hypothetical protein
VTLQADLLVMLPELILAVGAMALLLIGAVCGEKSAPEIGWGAIICLVLAGAAAVMGPSQATAFHDAFVADGFSRFAKLLILGGSAFSILLADEFFSDIKLSRFELPVLMLLATLGMMLMVSSSNFLSLYMGLELQSLALYVLAAFNHLEGFNEAWGRSPPILLHFVAEEPTAIGNDKERRCVDHDACCYEGGARSPGGRGKTRATSRGCIGLEWHTVAPIGGHHTGTRISDFRRPSHSRLAIQNYFSTHVLTL